MPTTIKIQEQYTIKSMALKERHIHIYMRINISNSGGCLLLFGCFFNRMSFKHHFYNTMGS